jgi:methanogenic corrinoid protein MtbC1
MDRGTQEGLLQAAVQGDCHWGSAPGRSAASNWGQAGPPEPAAKERLTRLMRTLEGDIIPRLVRAHRPAPAEIPAVPPAVLALTDADVRSFARLVIGHDDSVISAALAAFRLRGVTVESIYLELLAPAARHLGDLWDDDLCDFAEVTVGLGRLQQVMRELSPAFGSEVDHPADGRRALLVPAPGEQHTFGLSMVAEFFRRAGWEVVGGVGGPEMDPVEMVREEWFDVIGVSVGNEARLDWLRSGIADVRRASRNRAIGVMVGGPVFNLNPGYVSEVGADVTASDGRQAPVLAEGLLGQRTMRSST